MDKIDRILSRGVANIIPSKPELENLLKSDKKLNVYFGIDPTAPKIHLGHAVPLRKLQKFAKMGHNVTLIIGDFTALIGDTSDKDSERPVLTPKQIEENFQTYKKQAEKILDFSKIKVRHNSEWLEELKFSDIVKLCQHFSAGDFVGREIIRKRLEQNKRVGLHELLYPVMQGYDSYKLQTDIQIGGTDQIFNMQAGRTLIKDLEDRESFILSTEFLMGTDGRKMSKTWGNAIWLDDEPNEMYAKIMKIEDNLIISYFTLATNTPLEEIKKIEEELKHENPINIKKKLAETIVEEIYGAEPSKAAGEDFEKTVQQGELPTDILVYQYTGNKRVNIVDLVTEMGLSASKSDAKRLLMQGGIQIDNKVIKEPTVVIENDNIVQVGRRKFAKLVIKS